MVNVAANGVMLDWSYTPSESCLVRGLGCERTRVVLESFQLAVAEMSLQT